jgi:Amt family ammonium transporter
MSALVIGLLAGLVCYTMVAVVKQRLGYDDSLDAFGVHGIGGTLGALLTGVFATSAVNQVFKDAAGNKLPVGVIEGHWGQLGNQIVGILIAIVLSVVGTLVLLKLVDLVMGLRMSPEQEMEGMDVTQHGEEGYDWA